MKKAKKYLNIVGVLLITSFILFLIGMVNFYQKPTSNELSEHIPTDVKWVARIDQLHLMHQFIDELLADENPDVWLEKLAQKLNENTQSNELAGLDFLNESIIFETKEGAQILLLKTANETQLKESISKNKLSHTLFYEKQHALLFINDYPTSKRKKLALQILRAKNHKFNFNPKEPFKLLVLKSDESIQQLDLTWIQNKNAIDLEGKITFTQEFQTIPCLREKGFHITTQIIPTKNNAFFQEFAKSKGIKFPTIKAVSFNYLGLKFQKIQDQNSALPQFECLLTFDQNLNPEELKRMAFEFVKTKLDGNEEMFELLWNEIQIKVMPNHQVYLGTLKNPTFETSSNFIRVKGDLKALTTIENGGFVGAFIEMQPLFKATKNLGASIQNFDVSVQKSGKTKAILNFQPSKKSLLTLFNFMDEAEIMR